MVFIPNEKEPESGNMRWPDRKFSPADVIVITFLVRNGEQKTHIACRQDDAIHRRR